LKQSVGADAVWAEAILNAAKALAFKPGCERKQNRENTSMMGVMDSTTETKG